MIKKRGFKPDVYYKTYLGADNVTSSILELES